MSVLQQFKVVTKSGKIFLLEDLDIESALSNFDREHQGDEAHAIFDQNDLVHSIEVTTYSKIFVAHIISRTEHSVGSKFYHYTDVTAFYSKIREEARKGSEVFTYTINIE